MAFLELDFLILAPQHYLARRLASGHIGGCLLVGR